KSQSWWRQALSAFWHRRDRTNAPSATISFLPESKGQEGVSLSWGRCVAGGVWDQSLRRASPYPGVGGGRRAGKGTGREAALPGEGALSPEGGGDMLPVLQAPSVGVQSLLGAALHVQTLVAEEVTVLREAFDAVAALEGPRLVLCVRAAAVARQVL
ncbi:unnamed protein product, partial [Gulo gulo]